MTALEIAITDVIGQPLVGVPWWVVVESPPGTPCMVTVGIGGVWETMVSVGTAIKISVSFPGYDPLTAVISTKNDALEVSSDDAAVMAQMDILRIHIRCGIRLSRCAPAPLVDNAVLKPQIGAADLDNLNAVRLRLTGILSDVGTRSAPIQEKSIGDQLFEGIQAALLGDPSKTGIDRLAHASVHTNPLARGLGRLLFFEYGDTDPNAFAAGRRFLIAVWFPLRVDTHAAEILPPQMDLICWFTPSTYRENFKAQDPSFYPYGVHLMQPAASTREQPYIVLAYAHLCNVHSLARQIQAAGVDAAVIMPLSPLGKWGPFLSTAGWWRLIQETMLHIARYGSRETVQPQTNWVIPQLGKVVVATFSTGGIEAEQLLGHTSLLNAPQQPRYVEQMWSAPDADRLFHNHFFEFWDLDTSVVGLPSTAVDDRSAKEANWFAERSDRKLRIYRTDQTSPAWRPDSVSPTAVAFRRKLGVTTMTPSPPTRPATGDWAQLFTDPSPTQRWSVARFSDNGNGTIYSASGYIGGPKGLRPGLAGKDLAGHELIPRVCFGHALSLSSLKKRFTP